jgi:hypothetical protein
MPFVDYIKYWKLKKKKKKKKKKNIIYHTRGKHANH